MGKQKRSRRSSARLDEALKVAIEGCGRAECLEKWRCQSPDADGKCRRQRAGERRDDSGIRLPVGTRVRYRRGGTGSERRGVLTADLMDWHTFATVRLDRSRGERSVFAGEVEAEASTTTELGVSVSKRESEDR